MNSIISSGFCIVSNNKILLGKPHPNNFLNNWSIPKGKIELGESLFDAAIRETYEETSLNLNALVYKYNIRITKNPWKKIEYIVVNSNKEKNNKILNIFLAVEKSGNLQSENLKCLSKIPNSNFPEFVKLEWVDIKSAKILCFKSLRKIF